MIFFQKEIMDLYLMVSLQSIMENDGADLDLNGDLLITTMITI